MSQSAKNPLKPIAFILFFFFAASGIALGESGKLSDKWRIKIDGGAKSYGTMVFRITPESKPTVDISLSIEKHAHENAVAAAITDAFKHQLPENGYHVERDDFEDILIKKRGDTSKFNLELVSNNVEGISVRIHTE